VPVIIGYSDLIVQPMLLSLIDAGPVASHTSCKIRATVVCATIPVKTGSDRRNLKKPQRCRPT